MPPEENVEVQKAKVVEEETTPTELVIVLPVRAENGDLEISIQHQGVSIAEIPTLLALAKKQVEEKLGI